MSWQKRVAARTGLDTGQAKLALDATIEEITAQLAAGTRSDSPASVISRRSPGRLGRAVIRKPESIQIAAKTAAKFSPGAELKKAVNG
jgi:nucleoid DNA-binding protein